MSYSAVKTRPDLPELTISNAALLIAGVSLAALAGAWIIELIGYQPCPLCLEQRIPYYAAVPVGLVATFYARRAPKLAAVLLVALCLALLYNAGLGIYHAGAEWHFWAGPDSCSGDTLRVASLSKSLRHNQAVRCDEAALRIFGLSLAGYSVLISGGLATIGIRALLRDKSWRS